MGLVTTTIAVAATAILTTLTTTIITGLVLAAGIARLADAVLAYSPNSNLFPPTFGNEADSTQIQSQQQQPELTQQPLH